jgi:hypothetical protein
MGRRTGRIDYDLPRVHRDHFAAPGLGEEQGREALRLGRQLQESAVGLDAQHARDHADRLRRRRVIRLSALVFALEICAGVAVVGNALQWWPS